MQRCQAEEKSAKFQIFSSNNKMEEIQAMLQKIQTQLNEMNMDLKQSLKDGENNKEEIMQLRKAIEKREEKIENQEKKIKRLEEKVDQQEGKIEKLEREIKRRNLVIYGIPEQEDENLHEEIKNLMEKININIDYKNETENIRRIGINREKNNRPILIKFLNENKKYEVIKNAYKLKNTNYGISNDLTKKEMKEKQILLKYLKKAREDGYKASLKGKKLIINGEQYEIEELLQIEWYEEEKKKLEEKGSDDNTLKRKMTERSPNQEDEKTNAKKPNHNNEQKKKKWQQSLLAGFQTETKNKSTT